MVDGSPRSLIGPYQLRKVLASGRGAKVYLADDPRLDREVAVKIVQEDLGGLSESFRAEARTLAALQHSSIVGVYDCGIHSDQFYSVLEYVSGSFGQELDSSRISNQRTISVCLDVANALDYVHRRGFLHRNLKPAAILVNSQGQTKLSGFNVAVKRQDCVQDIVSVVGTPRFMAPEQLEAKELGPPTDIWALGVVMYRSLTGEYPFRGDTLIDILDCILHNDPVAPRLLATDIPEELERICLRCLSKNPRNRYLTGASLAEQLTNWERKAAPSEHRRVFVSHSGKDREFVESRIIPILERNGIKTWYSKVEIQTAAEWERSILQGLESCEWFLIVMSQRSAESQWVKDELFWATDKRSMRIVPVRIDDSDPRQFHIRLARIQNVDLRSDVIDAEQRIMQGFEA